MESSGDGGTGSSRLMDLTQALHKTKLCRYHKKGICRNGSECGYAHSTTEMKSVPDLKKTRLCLNYINNTCKSEDCCFAHSVEELRATDFCYKKRLCIWNQKGRCWNGEQCHFAHSTAELRSSNTGAGGTSAAPSATPYPTKDYAPQARARTFAPKHTKELTQEALLKEKLQLMEVEKSRLQEQLLAMQWQASEAEKAKTGECTLAMQLQAKLGQLIAMKEPMKVTGSFSCSSPQVGAPAAVNGAPAAGNAYMEAGRRHSQPFGYDAMMSPLTLPGSSTASVTSTSEMGQDLEHLLAQAPTSSERYGVAGPKMMSAIPSASAEEMVAYLDVLRGHCGQKDTDGAAGVPQFHESAGGSGWKLEDLRAQVRATELQAQSAARSKLIEMVVAQTGRDAYFLTNNLAKEASASADMSCAVMGPGTMEANKFKPAYWGC